MEWVINDRNVKIVGYNTERNWFVQLPVKEWLCVLLINDKPRRYIDEVISKIILKDVAYICSIGPLAERVHDWGDEEINFRESDFDKAYLPGHAIITTWDTDLEEGIWSSLYASYSEEVIIKEVVILDITDDLEIPSVRAYLEQLIAGDTGIK